MSINDRLNPFFTMTISDVRVAVRIGSGTKLHPGLAQKWESKDGRGRTRYALEAITCGCSGCASGTALQRASIVTDATPDCRGRS